MDNAREEFAEAGTAWGEVRRLEVDWARSEWFEVWLRLARRDYHGVVPGGAPEAVFDESLSI